MSKFCPQCGSKKRAETARFCRECGYNFEQRTLPALRPQTELTSFDPLHTLSALVDSQRDWLRRNTLLEPLQEILDNVGLRTKMEQATDIQEEQILAGYQEYTREQVEQVIDQVRHARQMGDADVALEIKERSLELEDEIAERAHQRRLERLREEHQHEKEMMELRAQLELVNAIIQSFNQLRMIQLESQAEGLADLEQMKMLSQVIQHSFTALAEIDAGQIEYAKRIKGLNIENLEDADSFDLIEELVESAKDRISKAVLQYGERSGAD